MSEPSAQLCQQAREGDREAASELVRLHYAKLFAWFRRICGQEGEAADLTQKTFCRAWSSLDSFQGRSSFCTWLHAIGYHVYLDWRRQHREPIHPGDEWWQNCPEEGPGPFETAADRDLAGQLYSWVEELAEESRQTVHLHYYQGLSLAETAQVLGVATSTVKYRLREAIEFLKSRAAEPRIR